MRRAFALIAALLVLAACGGSSQHRTTDQGLFVMSGHVILVGGTGEHAVIHITDDNTCYGVASNAAFQDGGRLRLRIGSSDIGSNDFTTLLGEGVVLAPGKGVTVTGCRFPFAIADVPSSTQPYTLTIGAARRTFTRDDLADPITVRVKGKPLA